MPITWDNNTRTLAGGAAFALVCGLILGGAMRPDLGDDGRPSGPQMISGWSGVRSTGPFDPGTAIQASYAGAIPDYVLGTDWKRSLAAPDDRAAVSEPAPQILPDDPPAPDDPSPAGTAPLTRAAYEGPPPPSPTRYPSMGGGLGVDPPDPGQAAAVSG